MAPILDAVLLEEWVEAAAAALDRHCTVIDRINVFPVADRDTGTNLLLTMRAAAAEVRSGVVVGASAPARGGTTAATAHGLARGALRGARGNSGVILSQVLRGVAEAVATGGGRGDGVVLAEALTRAARLATAAVSRPQEGTILTVLAAAATAARRTAGAAGLAGLDVVSTAAADAAGAAVHATTAQLPDLARAGVVDAGGLGLYLVLDALAALVTGRDPATLRFPDAPAADVPSGGVVVPAQSRCPPDAPVRPFYEVMYLLDGSDDARAAALRADLDRLGDGAAVVGDGVAGAAGTWTVHVHCADIGAALEAGLVAGRPHEVRVTPLDERAPGRRYGRFARERAVVAVLCGPDAAALARAAGADVLERRCPTTGEPAGDVEEAGLARVLARADARHVALLPCDADLAPVAERAAAAARETGQDVVVVPAASTVAGLAALAVHDPARRAADDVVAMTEAAAGTRTGALQVADSEALTWAGPCRPGDVLGLVEGEVVLIAPDELVGALWLASRMLTAGGELVTVLLGPGAAEDLGEELAAELRRSHPEVDVVVHRGARPGRPLELGVE